MWAHAPPWRSLTVQAGFFFFFLRFKDTFFNQNHNTVKRKAKGFPVRIKLITFSYQRRIQSQTLRQGWPLQEAAADTVLEAAPLVLAARSQGTECGGLGLLTGGGGCGSSMTPTRLGERGPGSPGLEVGEGGAASRRAWLRVRGGQPVPKMGLRRKGAEAGTKTEKRGRGPHLLRSFDDVPLPVYLFVERIVKKGRASHAPEQLVWSRQPLLRLVPIAAGRLRWILGLTTCLLRLAVILLVRGAWAAAPVSREIAQRILLLRCHDCCTGKPRAPPETGSHSRARPAVDPAPSLADGPEVCAPWRLRRAFAPRLGDWGGRLAAHVPKQGVLMLITERPWKEADPETVVATKLSDIVRVY